MLLESLTKDEKAVLFAVQKKGSATKNEIMREVECKSTTLNRLLNELKKLSLVVVSGEGKSTGGRRPLKYRINESIPIFFMGINLGMNHIELALLHFSGRLLNMQSVEYKRTLKPEQFLTIVRQLYHTAVLEAKITPSAISGGCLSVFCAIDREKGVIQDSVQAKWLSSEWRGYPIKENVEKCIGIKLMADMSINAISVYEYLFGNCRGHNRMAVMMCYHSLHMGCIQNGMLIRSADDMDNAFAHMVISIGGKRCECGDYGCVGAYGSAPAIVKAFVYELRSGRDSSLRDKKPEQLDIYEILRAADEGDVLAGEVVVRAANMVAVAATNYISLTNPDVLVCAGLLNERSELFHRTLMDTIKRRLAFRGREHNLVFVKRSELNRSVVGSATLAMEAALGKIF